MKKICVLVLFSLYISYCVGQDKVANLVILATATTDNQQKIQYLSDAIDLASDKAYLYKSRGDVQMVLQHSQEAIEDYDKAINLDSRLFIAFVARGQAKYDLGQYDDAIIDCNSAIKLDSANAAAYRLRAHTKKQQALFDESLIDYTKAISLATQQNNSTLLRDALNGRGNVFYYQSMYQKAKVDFLDAVKIDDKNYYALLKLGIIYSALQMYNDSRTSLEKAIPLLLTKKKYDLLAEAYIFKHRLNKAVSIMDTNSIHIAQRYGDTAVLKIKTNTPYAHYMRGWAYYEAGSYVKAIKDLNQAIAIRSDDFRYLLRRANTYYKLGDLLEKKGEKSNAMYYYKLAILDYQIIRLKAPALDKHEDFFMTNTENRMEEMDKPIPLFPLAKAEYHALIIGNSDYKNDWKKLSNPIYDADAVAVLLQNNYGFKIDTIHNVTKPQMMAKLRELKQKVDANPNLNILVYYAGHGTYDIDSEKGYIVPVDEKAKTYDDYIALSDIRDVLRGVAKKAQHILFISDACYGGDILAAKTRGKSEKQAGYEGRYERKSVEAVTAGAIQEVNDGSKTSKHSPFAEYMLKALEKNRKLYFDSSDLYDYLKDAIPNNNTDKNDKPQVPLHGALQSAGDEGGKFIFTKKK